MSTILKPSRRGFIIGTAALFCAPVIVRASSLMKVREIDDSDWVRRLDVQSINFDPAIGVEPPYLVCIMPDGGSRRYRIIESGGGEDPMIVLTQLAGLTL